MFMEKMWSKVDANHDDIFGESTEKQRGELEYFNNEVFENAFILYDKVMIKMQSKLEEYNKPVAPVISEIKPPETNQILSLSLLIYLLSLVTIKGGFPLEICLSR